MKNLPRAFTWLVTAAFCLPTLAADLPPEREAALQLQLFLDKEGFSPGPIDGKFGNFTQKAVQRWQKAGRQPALELDPKADLSAAMLPDGLKSDEALTTYTITEDDAKTVGELADDPSTQAKQENLPYTSVLEAVAEKFHAYPSLIEELNPDTDFSAGTKITVPNVSTPFDLSQAKELSKDGLDDKSGDLHIKVLRSEEIVEVFDGDKLIHSFPTTVGESGNKTPAGEFKVDVVQWMPEFRYDSQMLEQGERSSNSHMLPPGPNNPVGIIWMGISSDGIGLHGTSSPDTIGRSKSHGCIRLTNWDALKLGQKVKPGVTVEIQ